MALKLSNNANGLLAAAISNNATSLTLVAGHGSRFPALGPGDWFPITVVRASDPSQREIMRCTARSGDTLTVVRAQEGTSAITFNAGDVVSLRLTSGTLEENFVRRSDLTTSPTDTTPGRVLKVGDFGVGAPARLPDGTDLDTITMNGSYDVQNAVNRPAGTIPWGYLRVIRHSNSTEYCYQEWTELHSDGRTYYRIKREGNWHPWREFYHTGNIAKLISDGNLVQTNRTISAGTGLTGGGNLSANRKISLASSHIPIGVGQTWQYMGGGGRQINTTYTNTTGRPIMVAITLFSRDSFSFIVDGVTIATKLPSSEHISSNIWAVVPSGSNYRLEWEIVGSIMFIWSELR